MRDVAAINDAWRSGVYVGDTRPSTRVTVERGWNLHLAASVLGTWKRGPARWYQAANNQQVETEVPNILSVNVSRSSDGGAGTCEIVLRNVAPLAYGQPETPGGQLGQPGYYTWDRGVSQESKARWQQTMNPWNEVLVPNALIRCVDTETEILTRRGWLRWDEVQVGDYARGLDPLSGRSVWQEVKDVFRTEYVGPMVHMTTRSHDSLTTPDHKWLVTQSPDSKYVWRTTDGLSARSRIPMGVPPGDLNRASPHSDDFVELVAWYYTEGCAEHRLRSLQWGGSISQSLRANPCNVARIHSLMTRLFGEPGPLPQGPHVPQEVVEEVLCLHAAGVSQGAIAIKMGVNRESVRRWVMGIRPTNKRHKWRQVAADPADPGGQQTFRFTAEVGRLLREVVVGPEKVPTYGFLASLTVEQLDLFIDVSVMADGTVDRDHRIFIQGSRERVDAFEYACALRGIATHQTSRSDGMWSVALLDVDVCRPVSAVAQSPRGHRAHGDVRRVDYDGTIWCPSVEHGNWVARRNGCVYYTGNTYVGFGGTDKSIPDAVADHNLVLYGVWLVDDVVVSTDGTLNIKCRDMAKLLLDQQLFPPLVPASLYPLDYHRWDHTTFKIPTDTSGGAVGDHCFPCSYADSSTDHLYGQYNTAATGHPPTDAFDISNEPGPNVPGAFAHQRTFWLSESKGSPSDDVWIEFDVNGGAAGVINQIYHHPYEGALGWSAWGAGVYRIMVSVMENGVWVLPETHLGGITPEGIPYVSTFASGVESTPRTATNLYALPRDYQATKIRLTITNLIPTVEGGFRSGARKIMACFSTTANNIRLPPLTLTCAGIPVNTDNRMGYWQVRQNGQVYAFGDARIHPPNSPSSAPASLVIGMAAHPDGDGYWLVDTTGRVISFGSATHHGDLDGNDLNDVVDLAPTPTGHGYWLLRATGHIYSFGDATDHGESTHSATLPAGVPAWARSIESHPTTSGYWILWTDGFVDAHGLTGHGSAGRGGFTSAEYVTAIRRTSTGNGYWIVSGSAKVQAFGDAPAVPSPTVTGADAATWYKNIAWDLIPSSINDNGYAVQTGDGKLWTAGDPTGFTFGSVGKGSGQLRIDGNYKDYSDVVRDLVLWSGFYAYVNPQPATKKPDVYGNIETTGAYADDQLPKDMFDKKPIMDAIKQIAQIVGYTVYVDAEGGFRFASPNWWTLGNFLMDGHPYPHVPEIDETVQLIGHQVTRSASQARSKITISSADPYPVTPGEQLPKGIVTTEIVPKTASDLRGLCVPAMWINGQFLRPNEQRVMADLIDMRMWFSRRTANVTCVANPLIDIDDQVRVIERQSGEVYIHYIKGVNFTHDLTTGDFKMSLTTYWLGGSPWGKFTIFYTGAARPAGDGYWTVTWGGTDKDKAVSGVYAYGAAQLYKQNEADSHLEFIMAMRSTPSGDGYYTLDESGKVLTYGDAVNLGGLYRGMKDPKDNRRNKDVVDMALTPSGLGYWLVQKDGTVTAFGDAVHYGNAHPTDNLPSGAEVTARSIESHPDIMGYWVLSDDGTVEAFNLADFGSGNRDGYKIFEFATRLRRTVDGDGYWILSGTGIVQAKGGAPWRGSITWDDQSTEPWYDRLYWDMLVGPDNNYALIRSDGDIQPFDFTLHPKMYGGPPMIAWALVSPEDYEHADQSTVFGVSDPVMKFLAKTASPSANNAVVRNFAAPSETTIRGAP